MSKTVICRIIPTDTKRSPGYSPQPGAGKMVTLQIHSASGGKPRRLIFSQPQNLKLAYGDILKCVSGSAAVLINPGTQAGIFNLCSQLSPHADWKTRTELEINDETTKIIHRGNISVTSDIGTVLTGGTKTTR